VASLVDGQLAALAESLATGRKLADKGLSTSVDVLMLSVVLLGTEHLPALFTGEVVMQRVSNLQVTAHIVLGGVDVSAASTGALVCLSIHFFWYYYWSLGLDLTYWHSARPYLSRLNPHSSVLLDSDIFDSE